MNFGSYLRRGAASREVVYRGVNGLLVNVIESSASPEPRGNFDFGSEPPSSAVPKQISTLRHVYLRCRRDAVTQGPVQADKHTCLADGRQARIALGSSIRGVARREQTAPHAGYHALGSEARPAQSLEPRVRRASRLCDVPQDSEHCAANDAKRPHRGWLPRLTRLSRRARAVPSPAEQVSPPDADLSALEGGKPITHHEANVRLMGAALAYAIPALKQEQDEATQARARDLSERMLALGQILAGAEEFGFSTDRILSTLREHSRSESAAGALDFSDRMIDNLTQCLTRDAVDGKPSRSGLILAGLHLVMPQLSAATQSNDLAALNKGLLRLDACFSGRPGYDFDRLLSVLCNHARIVEFGKSSNTVDQAVIGLRAMVDTVSDSIGSNRDGYALNTLIGIDSQLDDAIVDLRTSMVEKFMAVRSGVPVNQDPSMPLSAETLAKYAEDLADDAKQLVAMECELARAKVRLMRAFDRAGLARPVEVLRGMRMDSAMVKGLVNELERHGKHAKDVGLAIMAVYLMEQEISYSRGGMRMLQCVREETARSKPGMSMRKQKADIMRARAAKTTNAEQASRLKKQIYDLGEEDRASVRRIEHREKSLADPGHISHDLIKELGLQGMELKHVRQLERQGLSSAAEARRALALIQKSLDTWLASQGLSRMKKQGLFTALRSRQQEERAALFGKTLLERRQREDGTLVPFGDDPVIRKELVRAAILHLVPIEKKARAKKAHGSQGMPVLASFRPSVNAVRGQLVKWGLDGDLTADIEAEIGFDDGVTLKKLASWVREAELLPELPATVLNTELTPQEQADELKWRLEKLLPRKSQDAAQIEFLKDDEIANQLIVRDAVRAVILGLLAADPFGPQPERNRIEAMLAQRGVLGAAAVVAEETATPMTPAKLAAWQQDAVARELRKELVDSLTNVTIGTRVAMSRWQRLKLTSGFFGDKVGLSGRMSAGRMTGVDFGNAGDPGGSLENTFRSGGEAKVGIDFRAPVVGLGRILGLKLGPVLSADAAGQRLRGVVVRCKVAADQQELTRKLLQKSRVTFDDLAKAENIMLLREVRVTGEVGAGAFASVQPDFTEVDLADAHQAHVGMGARAVASVGLQWARSVAENNKGQIERTEWVKTARATASLYASGSVRADEDTQGNLVTQLADIGVQRELVVTDRIRIYERDGVVVEGERFDQSYLAGKSAVDLVKRLGGPIFERSMELLAQDEKTKAVHQDIIKLVADIRKNELVSLAWSLDETAGLYAGNAVLGRSNAARDHRVHHGGVSDNQAAARKSRNEAQKIFKDKKLFNIARVTAMPKIEKIRTTSYLLGLFETSLVTTATTLPEEIMLYAEELVHLTAQARKELRYGVSSAETQ